MFTAIWIVAFLLNGEPVAFTSMLPEGQMCSDDVALAYVHAKAQETNTAYQDLVLWKCESVTSPGPAQPIEHEEYQPVFKRDAA